MIFWDTSAVVPLLVNERMSQAVRKVALSDPGLIVFWTTAVECSSAIARREREGTHPRATATAARKRLAQLRSTWTEVHASEEVRDHAERLLLRHALRAADALQLGAALVWTSGRPRAHRFACFDHRLASAARAEGFDVIDESTV